MDITTIVVPDAASTPVNHTFVPNKIDGDTAKWVEKSASHPSGYWTLAVSLRDPVSSNGSRVYRSQISLIKPTLVTEVINGVSVPKVAYTHRVNVEMIEPADGVLQDRKDLKKILIGILGNAVVTSVVEDLDHVT